MSALPCCEVQHLLHVSCPTCGLTRALAMLARGDLAGSLAMHPMAAALVAQAGAGVTMWGRWMAGTGDQRPDARIPRVVAINAVAFVGLWVLRMLTGTLPAP